MIFTIFFFGFFESLCVAYSAWTGENISVAGSKNSVKLSDIIFHIHRSVFDGVDFCQVKVTRNEVV